MIAPGVARVLLVDDHDVVRQGLRSLIEMEEDMAVVGEAATADQAVAEVEADPPDLVVMDVRLPDRSGISACQEITSRHPGVKVVVLTSSADVSAVSSARAARASGFLLKSVGGSGLVEGLRRALRGEGTFEGGSLSADRRLFMSLSPQERVLAGHLASGLTNREIAARMGLAEKTVKNYVSNILTKLGMPRRSEVAAFVARGPGHDRSALLEGFPI
jgi:two-component system response regulator DevR